MNIELIIIIIVIVVVLFMRIFIFMKDKFKKEGDTGFRHLNEFGKKIVVEAELEPINRTQIRRLSDFLKEENKELGILRVSQNNFETIWNEIANMHDEVNAGQADAETYNQFVDIINWPWEIRITSEIEYNFEYLNDIKAITQQLQIAQNINIFTGIVRVSFENVIISKDDLARKIPNIKKIKDFKLIDIIKTHVSYNQIDGFSIEFKDIILE